MDAFSTTTIVIKSISIALINNNISNLISSLNFTKSLKYQDLMFTYFCFAYKVSI